jgi:hypothetical protein
MLYGGKYYCTKCQKGISDARKSVCHDIDPRECFVEFQGGDTWGKIIGTGCAHWVAHETNRSGGRECLLGHTLRVEDLIAGLSKRSSDHGRRNISVGDIYVTANHGHCGLVVSVDKDTERGGKLKKIPVIVLVGAVALWTTTLTIIFTARGSSIGDTAKKHRTAPR